MEEHQAPFNEEDHTALAAEIKAAFPDRGLGYLVDYSVYGLFIGQ